MRFLFLLCGVVLFTPAVAAPDDTMEQRVKACTGCHRLEDRQGPDAYYPRIAGKPAAYLYNQLLNFRDGRRHYPLMTYLVEHLSDDYLREMAQYFSELEAPYPPPQRVNVAPELMARGRALAMEGDRARELPACAACHGENLMGVEPATPGLLGLSREYIAAQTGAWKSATRRAHAPDCMADIAKRLSNEEVAAVSAWLAMQPVPAGAKPSTKVLDVPMECGSAPRAGAKASQ